ncbi:MAG: hypothetical protein AB1898_18450 [Acidobacteriota bacterium]
MTISRTKSKALMLMVAVFLLGAVVGASLATSYLSRSFAHVEGKSEPAGKDKKAKLIEKFRTELGLSVEQTEAVQSIMAESHKQFEALHHSVRPQFEKIRDEMRAEIREVLKGDQLQKFEAMNQAYDERRKREGK